MENLVTILTILFAFIAPEEPAPIETLVAEPTCRFVAEDSGHLARLTAGEEALRADYVMTVELSGANRQVLRRRGAVNLAPGEAENIGRVSLGGAGQLSADLTLGSRTIVCAIDD